MSETRVADRPTGVGGAGGRGRELDSIVVIAQRDITKFLSDRPRIVATFALPFLLMLILGRSFQTNLGSALGYDYLTFVFTGVYAQTLFQSAALGLVSLLEDRENDFTQELFIAPVSRYSIILGKILGEALVALVQGVGILLFGLVIGVRFGAAQVGGLLLIGLVVCLYGGAFGVFTMSTVRSRQFAQQLFNFVFLPQFLLAGVFNPIDALPGYLDVLSRIAPMRYAVDIVRVIFYAGSPERPRVVVDGLAVDVVVIAVVFAVLLVVGTTLFVRNERNR
jgi:ABC-2 type transport system permease protein